MSTLYNLEPTPTAKVLLQTTAGDIVLELFAKQTPLASRNFLQHCLDGYYNGTIFHRVVPGFILQGGDPTGTGFGGESIYDDGVFADEFHSRLKYTRRGLLGMANSGKKDDNGSQFFITLGSTPELTNKNTLFGRIAGDTIFNVVKISEAEMTEEGSERPLYPEKITGAEILVNPFEDMVKRDIIARSKTTEKDKAPKKKPKRKPGKSLLSFGDDGDEDMAPVVKKPKFNPKAVSGGNEPPSESIPMNKEKAKKAPKVPSPSPSPSPEPANNPEPKKETSKPPPREEPERTFVPPPPKASRKEKLNEAHAEIEALKASLRRGGPEEEKEEEKPKSALEAMIPSTAIRGRKRGGAQNTNSREEARTMALFKAFKSKLDVAPEEEKKPEPDVELKQEIKQMEINDDEEAVLCDLHFIANCQSCSNWTGQDKDEDETGEGWMSHKLTFEKDRLGKDLEWKRKNEEELLVVDPLEKAKELGVEKVAKSGRDKRSNREWDRPRDKGPSRR